MIGRARTGAPWISRSVTAFLDSEKTEATLSRSEGRDIILAHLDSLYAFYGEGTGVRVARKHLGWYCEQCFRDTAQVRRDLMGAASTAAQFALAGKHFYEWADEAAQAA